MLCISLMISDAEHFYTCLLAICISSLGKCLFFFMLSYMICLYMLDINPLLIISLANIFSHSVGCLFILLIISFAVQKFLSLIRSQLFLFPLFQEMDPKKVLQFMLKSVLPMFSSRSFIVFSLTLRSLIYFEFIFVYGIRECSNFILLQVAVSFSSITYWRHCLFSIEFSWLLCCRLVDHRCVGLFLGFLSCSLDL